MGCLWHLIANGAAPLSDQLDSLLARFGAMVAGWTQDTPLADMRSALDGHYTSYPEAPQTRVTVVDSPVPGEWVAAEGAAADRALLLLHGGGFSMGSARAHRAYASHMSKACAARVLTIDYRLAPENLYPAALDDAVTAYRALLGDGMEPRKIALCGDSAGGGLALALLVRLRDEGVDLPACAVLVSPWADLACAGESYTVNAALDPIASRDIALGMARTYLGEAGDPHDPLASPVYADLYGLPPLLIEMGEREVFLDDGRTIERRVGEAGGEATLRIWPGMIHQFPLHVGILDESAAAVAEIGAFIRERLG